MLADTYNSEGKEMNKTQLPKEIFGREVNIDLIRQVVYGLLSNERQNIAHTKDRSEVSGGGRKPWRQKGTGRARHGSIRSPLWKGGGVTFGPRNSRNYKKDIPAKMRKAALCAVLSGKLRDNELIIVDKLELKEQKTKEAQKILKNILDAASQKGSVLIILPQGQRKLKIAFHNIKKCKALEAKDINATDIVKYKNIIMLKDSIKDIKA